jgi:hypothetical protein
MDAWDEWNPGNWTLTATGPVFVPYEKRWYCNETKRIHGNKKEVENCKYCKTKL